jgi:hypothetical protein
MPNTREKLFEMNDVLCKSLHCDYDELQEAMCIDTLLTAENLIAHGVTVQEWIPVTEKSPKPLEKVLTYRKSVGDNYSKIAIDYMFVADGKSYWSGDLETWKTVATHWMPLPEAPKGE